MARDKEFFVMFEVKSKRKEKIRWQTYPKNPTNLQNNGLIIGHECFQFID
jgi:hypothetical protein